MEIRDLMDAIGVTGTSFGGSVYCREGYESTVISSIYVEYNEMDYTIYEIEENAENRDSEHFWIAETCDMEENILIFDRFHFSCQPDKKALTQAIVLREILQTAAENE